MPTPEQHTQALKQLGPSTPGTGASSAPTNGATVLPPAAPAPPIGIAGMSPEQLSNLAAVLALEGVPHDVVLQTLGLPPSLAAALAQQPEPMGGLGGLDGTAALLAQALAGSPGLGSQSSYDLAASRGSFDLRTSFDLGGAGLGSARTSMDLAALQQGLAARGIHAADSHSTLSNVSEWSNAPSARTSMDLGALAGLPAATAGFLASAGPLGSGGLGARLSLDAALQLQQSQQQQAALLAAQATNGRLSSSACYPPLPQHNMANVMHSGFYQPAPPPPQQPQPVRHSMQAVMSSGLYGGGGVPAPSPPPVRHSMYEFGGGTGLLPFGDTWAPAPQPQQGVQQQGMLGGYSTVLRPSIDRSGLPPLPPRGSPNQGAHLLVCVWLRCSRQPASRLLLRKACCLSLPLAHTLLMPSLHPLPPNRRHAGPPVWQLLSRRAVRPVRRLAPDWPACDGIAVSCLAF